MLNEGKYRLTVPVVKVTEWPPAPVNSTARAGVPSNRKDTLDKMASNRKDALGKGMTRSTIKPHLCAP
ncbi:hypothetical protein MTO96_038525 [Rhipicephalus appendiculatus]